MALVDPNIAMSFRPTTEYQPRNALADYANVQQIQSGQMQLQDYRQKSEALERMRTAIRKAGGPDLETAALEMMQVPEYAEHGSRLYETIRDTKAFEEYLKGKEQPVGASPVGASPVGASPVGAPTGASYRVPVSAADEEQSAFRKRIYEMGKSAPKDTRDRGIATKEDLLRQQLLDKVKFDSAAPVAPTNALAPTTAAAPVAAPTNALAPVAPIAAPVNALTPAAPVAPTAAPVRPQINAPLNSVEAIENEIMQLSRFKDPRAQARVKQLERQLIAMEPRTVGGSIYIPQTGEFLTPQSGKLVPVLVNGQPTLVPADQAVGMTPVTKQTIGKSSTGAAAKAEESASTPFLTRKEMEKREAALPKATQSVKIVGNTMSTIGQTVDRLISNEEGLNSITGLVYGSEYAPAVTNAARLAKADLEQLKNLAFVQGLTELREASKTGAGVGNVSNKEGERFENLKASLDRKQSVKSLKEALLRLKAQAEFTKQSLQEAFDQTYEYRGAPPSAKSPRGVTTLTPEDRQALNWANSNPKDPRAIQIKQRLGQ